jgi:hypothetical protein
MPISLAEEQKGGLFKGGWEDFVKACVWRTAVKGVERLISKSNVIDQAAAAWHLD